MIELEVVGSLPVAGYDDMAKKPTSENEKKRPRPPAPLNPELTWKGCDRKFHKQWCSFYLITYQRIASLTARGNWDGSIFSFRSMMAFGVREAVKHIVIYAKLHVRLGGVRGHLRIRGCVQPKATAVKGLLSLDYKARWRRSRFLPGLQLNTLQGKWFTKYSNSTHPHHIIPACLWKLILPPQ